MLTATPARQRFWPVVCLLLFVLWPGAVPAADDIRYDAAFELLPNGDCQAVIKLIPPMLVYQKLRDSVSNLYLVMRTFASSRADTETVDKKADWDDSKHTLTFSMKILGAGRNMGTHWEMDIPKEMEFSNLDESKRTLYFNQNEATDDWAMRGMARLVLPATAGAMRYDAGRHVASFVLPVPKAPSALRLPVLVGLGLAGLGAVLLALSFFLKTSVHVYPVAPSDGMRQPDSVSDHLPPAEAEDEKMPPAAGGKPSPRIP